MRGGGECPAKQCLSALFLPGARKKKGAAEDIGGTLDFHAAIRASFGACESIDVASGRYGCVAAYPRLV